MSCIEKTKRPSALTRSLDSISLVLARTIKNINEVAYLRADFAITVDVETPSNLRFNPVPVRVLDKTLMSGNLKPDESQSKRKRRKLADLFQGVSTGKPTRTANSDLEACSVSLIQQSRDRLHSNDKQLTSAASNFGTSDSEHPSQNYNSPASFRSKGSSIVVLAGRGLPPAEGAAESPRVDEVSRSAVRRGDINS